MCLWARKMKEKKQSNHQHHIQVKKKKQEITANEKGVTHSEFPSLYFGFVYRNLPHILSSILFFFFIRCFKSHFKIHPMNCTSFTKQTKKKMKRSRTWHKNEEEVNKR